MKTLTMFLEGNSESVGIVPNNTLGVTNHLSPVDNIVTMARNLFGTRLGWVITTGEDGVSLKVSCSRFTTPEIVDKEMYSTPIDNLSTYGTSMSTYMAQQGLNGCKKINLGREFVVYFYPTDLATSDVKTADDIQKDACKCDGKCDCGGNCKCTDKKCKCHEMLDYNIEEAEISYIRESEDDEDELEDIIAKEVEDIINMKDKMQATKAFAEKIKSIVRLPENYYFAAVKDKEGNESIALRHKFEKKRPFGKTVEVVKSLMNIYGTGKDAIWIPDWDDKNVIKTEDQNLIQTILDWLKAGETKDECIWYIGKLSDEDKKKIEKDKPEEPKVEYVLKTEDGEEISRHKTEEEALRAADDYNAEHEDSPVTVQQISDDEEDLDKKDKKDKKD